MEEDIKILEKINITAYGTKEELEALGKELSEIDINKIIKNLINKYKEQKRDIRDNHILLAKYSQKNEEQEKIIDLMASFIEVAELDEDIAKTYCLNEACTEINEFTCKKCIKDHFKKKARGNNGES